MEPPADGECTGGATPGVEGTIQPAPSAKRPKLNAGNILSFFTKAQTLTTGKDACGKTPGGAGASGEGSTNEHAVEQPVVDCDGPDARQPNLDDHMATCFTKQKEQMAGRSDRERRAKYKDSWGRDLTTGRKFPWLYVYNEGDVGTELILCTWCYLQGQTCAFTKGCSSIRETLIRGHPTTGPHLKAIQARAEGTFESVIVRLASALESNKVNNLKKMMCAYAIGKEDLSFRKQPALTELVRLCGSGMDHHYCDRESARELVKCISSVIRADQLKAIKASPVFGIAIDESTAIDLDKVLVIYVRYIIRGPQTKKLRAITEFLSAVHVDDGTGATVKERLRDYLFEELELDRSKMYTFASDGASAMVGEGKGVVGRLTRDENPFLVAVHCICHRLALASADAADLIDFATIYEKFLNNIYSHFSRSTNRTQRWREMCEKIEGSWTKLVHSCQTRWLSRDGAVTAVVKHLQSLVEYFKQQDGSKELDEDAVVHALGLQLTNFQIVSGLFFFADVLQVLATTSRRFQKVEHDLAPILKAVDELKKFLRRGYASNSMMDEEANFSSPKPLAQCGGLSLKEIAKAIQNIDTSKEFATTIRSHSIEGKAGDVDKLERLVSHFTGALYQRICDRFPHCELLDAFQIFDPSYMDVDLTEADLRSYGDAQIEVLIAHYGTAIGDHPAVVNPDALRAEWDKLRADWWSGRAERRASNQQVPASKRVDEAAKFEAEIDNLLSSESIPNISLFAAIRAVRILSSAMCESGFSVMGRIKDKYRNHLGIVMLDACMRISILGPNMSDHAGVRDICTRALELWESLRTRNPFKGNPGKRRISRKLNSKARKVSLEDQIFQHLGDPLDEDVQEAAAAGLLRDESEADEDDVSYLLLQL